ncbi:hypothetical protein [uncultured Campylobacter sp.]|nr:hypothetical protein [uncultured Campylobacter sp.]
MVELIKNIGLGLFVNSSYAIMGGALNFNNAFIMLFSVGLMYQMIKRG